MIYSGINGIGLALVVPCVQSLIADYTPAEKRGAAFGVLYFTGALGELSRMFCMHAIVSQRRAKPRIHPYDWSGI